MVLPFPASIISFDNTIGIFIRDIFSYKDHILINVKSAYGLHTYDS